MGLTFQGDVGEEQADIVSSYIVTDNGVCNSAKGGTISMPKKTPTATVFLPLGVYLLETIRDVRTQDDTNTTPPDT